MTSKTKTNINLIWKHTHKDFKGKCSIEKSIMTRGSFGPISHLSDMEFKEELQYAQRKEIRLQRDKALKPIFASHNINPAYLTSTDQGRNTLNDVISLINFVLTGDLATQAIEAVKSAGIAFLEE